MNKQTIAQQSNESITAVHKYIQTKKVCQDRHAAHIIASINNHDHFGVLTVFASATENYASVIIENLCDICNAHTNLFTIENCEFTFIGKTLIINAQNTSVGSVYIEVTAK